MSPLPIARTISTCDCLDGMRGPMLLVYGLLALYALEIVLPLIALAIAFVTRRARAIIRLI